MPISADDFEVSIFLTEIGTRHSLLVKSKVFKETNLSNSHGPSSNEKMPMVIREESDEEDLELHKIPSAGSQSSDTGPPVKRIKQTLVTEEDDKKKWAFTTSYDGFSIWGWVLCLLVERTGGPGKKAADSSNAQTLMSEWISTQQQHNDE